ncbi:MAG TPA: hypothetical protein PLV68_13000, partial [Ilumatobacteraceae bacterium]|nr:hypothetical protein [Ilumatobacteraceae bacterium]
MIASAFGTVLVAVGIVGLGLNARHLGVVAVGLLAVVGALWLLVRCARVGIVIDRSGIVVRNVTNTR